MNMYEYLSRIKELETLCYKQKLYIDNLSKMLNKASHPSYYEIPKKSKPFFTVFNCLFYGICGPITLCITLFAFGLLYEFIVFLINWIFNTSLPYIEDPVGRLVYKIPICLGIIFLLLSPILIIIERSIIKDNTVKQGNLVTQKNELITKDSAHRTAILTQELKKAEETFASTRSVLNMFYNKNIIYDKYRSIVPITMFCEYFASGRCSTLTGHEGAYNIYENELRLNLIVGKLEHVIQRLDAIESNQYMLANEIKKSNKEIQNLSSQVNTHLNVLEKNSYYAAYYSGISAINTTYTAWLKKYE